LTGFGSTNPNSARAKVEVVTNLDATTRSNHRNYDAEVRSLAHFWALPLATACASFLMSMVMQRRGVVLSPDGWAYWEASVSLLEGKGYRYFGGQPLVAWPPAFAAYLALWQGLLGISARTIALAHAFAVGAASGIWTSCALLPRGSRRLDGHTSILALVMAFSLPIALREVLSESLFLAFLAAAFWLALWRTSLGARALLGTGAESIRVILVVIAFLLSLLTRNLGVAFAPALAWLIARRSEAWGRAPWIVASGAVATAVGGWLACRIALGQMGSHRPVPLSLDSIKELIQRLLQNLRAAWLVLLPVSFAGAALAAAAIAGIFLALVHLEKGRAPGQVANRLRAGDDGGLLVAAALGIAGTAAVLAGFGFAGVRFVLPMLPLVLLAADRASTRATRAWIRRLAAAALAVAALTQLARGAYWFRVSTDPNPVGVPMAARVVATCLNGPPDCVVGPREISPPTFEWIDREYAHRVRPTASVK
jgi:hypothetical protein